MTKNKCAKCGKGEVRFQRVKDFDTKVRGIAFTVPEATVGICDSCGAKFFSPQEIRRWQQLFEAEQTRIGALLSAEEIENIRKGLRLPINLFAQLLGTTRQSVYNWERKDRKSPQLRLVDLLLRLVRESMTSGTVNVLHFLGMQSDVELTAPNQPPECVSLRPSGRKALRRRWRDPGEYDRTFATSGRPIPLPGLRSY